MSNGSGLPADYGSLSDTRGSAGRPDGWIRYAARAGYTAKGVVYLVIGGMAATAAFTAARAEGSEAALEQIARQTYGELLLGLVAVGLACYTIWRLVQAMMDPEHKGDDASGLGARTYCLISGLIYGGLVVTAVRILTGDGSGGGSSGAETSSAFLLSQPLGRWLVAAVGAGVAINGVYQLIRGYEIDFTKRMTFDGVGPTARRWLVRLGRFGLAARGVVFCIIGGFLLDAAWSASAERARGLSGALRALEASTAGPWVLFTVAVGLAAYGAHQISKARFRKIG